MDTSRDDRDDRIRAYWAAGFYILALAAQVSGVTSGWIALGLATIATMILVVPCCHHINRWHIARVTAGKRTVEPWHLQITGLAGVLLFAGIALAGVIWQGNRSAAKGSASSIETIASTSLPTQQRYLSSEDKKRVDDALFKLSDLLNRSLKAATTESNHVISGWSHKKMDNRTDPASEIAEMLPKLQTLRTNLKGINNAIVGQLYKEYEDYSEILRDITLSDREPDQQRPIDSFQLRTEEFIRALETFRAAYDPTKVERSRLVSDLLDPRQDALVSAMHRVNIWIEGCRVRIADTKKAYNL